MHTRTFSGWFATFRSSINGYGYYTDFKQAYLNAECLKIEINILNSLVGSENIEADFREILAKYPECLKAIPILLAVRKNEIHCTDEKFGSITYRFDEKTQTVEQYTYFMRQTGLFDLLQHRIVSNLYDYVTGVEIGLDSNGRKNRGGHQMEELTEHYLKKAGVKYYKEMDLTEVEHKYHIDLSVISSKGISTKRWDFIVKTPNCIYAIETNFYASGGSKLNETARSYKMLAEEAKHIKNFKFIWITDGGGWKHSRRNLEETFNVLEDLYNIADMENRILEIVLK